jgi:RimJ/RimL family protein N-acetyltransferase
MGIKLIQNILDNKIHLSIEILDDKSDKIGFLMPITKSTINDLNIINKLTDWRNKFMRYFLTQFHATNDRTLNWIENNILNDNTKMLFIIYDKKANPIGNLGFTKLTNISSEIDNLIKGEESKPNNIIYFAELALINWMFSNLSIREIYGHVFSDNIAPIMIHREVGFEIIEKIKVYKYEINNEVHWKLTDSNPSSSEQKFIYKIILNNTKFKKNDN